MRKWKNYAQGVRDVEMRMKGGGLQIKNIARFFKSGCLSVKFSFL